mgnify:FL=1
MAGRGRKRAGSHVLRVADVKVVEEQSGRMCAKHAVNNVLQRIALTTEEACDASAGAGNNRSTYWSDDDVVAFVERAGAFPILLESKTTFSTAESRRAWMDDVLDLDSLVGFVELSGVHWFARVRALRGDGESVYVKVRGCARARAGNTKQNKAPNSHLRVHTGRFQRGQEDEKFGQ